MIDGGPNAIRERFDFKCDRHYTDMMIDMELANSGNDLKYLAEWHTHPQIYPSPSEIDLDSLDNVASSSTHFGLIVIIGFLDFLEEDFIEKVIAIVKFIDDENYYSLKCEI